MDAERFRVVRDVLERALELPDSDTQAFVLSACGDDDELRAEVEAMLGVQARAGEILGGVESEIARELVAPEAEPLVAGERIGRYRIVRTIATGGMGTVYEAEQDDPARSVALKVLNPGLFSARGVERFRKETRVLGRLRHPGIAQIYEAGVHVDALGGSSREVPFFALEYVSDARTLPVYASEHELEGRARIELFLDVCEAVHYGHEAGVIHRDLKPDNLLVDGNGHAKVIDFGVARAAETDVNATAGMTLRGEIVGTLRTMSPEQFGADSDAVDERSDVYALGVVLYELVVGAQPYDLDDAGLHEIARIVTESPPRRPSAVTSIDADLETIVLAALEKEPARRYASVRSFADDLRRYLRQEPIRARPQSATYQLRMYSRRHRGVVVSLTLLFVVLTVGLVISTRQTLRAQAARADAEREGENYRFIDELLLETIGSPHPLASGPHARVADVLDRAVRTVRERAADVLEPALAGLKRELGGDDAKTLRCQGALVSTRLGQGRFADGLALADDLLPRAQARLGAFAEETVRAGCDAALLVAGAGDLGAALSRADGFEAQVRAELGANDPRTLVCTRTVGELILRSGNALGAEEPLRAVVDALAGSVDADHYDLQVARTALADCLRLQKRHVEADALLRIVLDTQQRDLGPEHEATLRTRVSLGGLMHLRGDLAGSEELLTDTLATIERRFDPDHPLTSSARDALADVYQDEDKLGEAEALFTRSLEVRRATLPKGHPDRIINTSNLGSVLYLKGDFARAAEVLERAIAEAPPATGPGPLASVQVNLADVYTMLGRFDEAEELLTAALGVYASALAEDHLDVLRAKNNLARVYERTNRVADARDLYGDVYEGESAQLGEGHPKTIGSHNNFAQAIQALGDYALAEERFEALLPVAVESLGAAHQTTVSVRNNLALSRHFQGRLDEAIPEYERALTDCDEALGAEHPLSLQIASNLGHAYDGKGNVARAIELFERAVEGYAGVYGADAPQIPPLEAKLEGLYAKREG